MLPKSQIFEKTYINYLAQIAHVDFMSIKDKLGVKTENDQVVIPLFEKNYYVSKTGILDPKGKKPDLSICVIFFKYLLMCPDTRPDGNDWLSYKDLKDSGPLINYFTNNVEGHITESFSGRLDELHNGCKKLGGLPPDMELSYDLIMQFNALPKVPLLMLFNDRDEEFPAQCTILFEKRAEDYLDCECLAMVGGVLAHSLGKGLKN